MTENGDPYLGVATDHVIESFRNRLWANPNTLSQTPQGISKISTCLAMPRSERFSGVAAMPFDCNSFEASLSVTTRLVAKMERDVASPWTRAAIFTVRPK